MTSRLDSFITEFDRALRAMLSVPAAQSALPPRRLPVADVSETPAAPLTEAERRHAAGLMRVDHVGEVCAQALYHAQGLATSNPQLKHEFESAAREESDHLAWTSERLKQLNSHTSLFNPLWYAGSFALGWLAGKAGDRLSLGFVVETEKQVEQHLARHLERLPENDVASRAIVAQMRDDEMRHGMTAQALGGSPLPRPVELAMRTAAKVMTTTAYWI